ncbi:hypothetical protein CROQUDRAFT_439605 [Cronartium quercuum f. sp. fusiforme G11]|uniref:Uncharacterized protein n=1 Tax=Cronartium quercuum f. sp. fusiforme G11 TaxID=708437 RepID=A0A9P6NLU1_9BASI|nr:hypothetical protein CROQUDRAFT_439605 [Cronartium quercuum f. sp. fusiforme G11]
MLRMQSLEDSSHSTLQNRLPILQFIFHFSSLCPSHLCFFLIYPLHRLSQSLVLSLFISFLLSLFFFCWTLALYASILAFSPFLLHSCFLFFFSGFHFSYSSPFYFSAVHAFCHSFPRSLLSVLSTVILLLFPQISRCLFSIPIVLVFSR